MAWCALFNVDSAAAITHNGVYHVAYNGVMCFPYAGFISIFPSTHSSTSRRPRVVTLAGQPKGWPVPFLPGTANPVNVTAPIEICSSSGDSLTSKKEAVYHG
ncbi:ash family protein [Salmonella enterica]